ncbi:mitogen-activated protein kinase kinase kinase 1-like isoform X2 [Raphanus sativus]|uniref:mitogen-activated protein kinase kinase kinase n=1 Tax=Raphanus sativus TaxID=3726 RepID=A0A9W3C0M8_RAPSA|nr:mitogen-activated protein kinase kinase kinase 1-like isoform X2 [Raphanus sativus]
MKKSSGRSDHVVKHSNAGAASFSSSSSEDLSVSNSSVWSVLMTRSKEFPDRISLRNFRVEYGNPYDLAIPVDAWEAFKLKIDKRPVQDLNEARLLESVDTNEGGGPSSSSGENPLGSIDPPANTLAPALPFSTVFDTSPIYSSGFVITSWLKGELLGQGSFGFVYEGISSDGDFFAVKEVSLLDQGSHAQECIQQEIALLSQLQHQHIVRYRGTAKDGSNLYIFLELVSQGSLLKLYRRYPLPNSVVSTYTRQILDGLKYLHGEGFIHRDIKCANVLVDTTGAVKLADFGLAKVSKLNDIKLYRGDPFWMAPEVINPKRTDGYGSSADIWSLGCTVLEMLTRKFPYFDPENPYQAPYRIGKGELPDIPDTLSLDARDFIIRCLRVNPKERPTAAELLNHPFASP